MRELNVNEIEEVSGGLATFIRVLDWIGRGSTALDIAASFQEFSEACEGVVHQDIHPIAAALGRRDE